MDGIGTGVCLLPLMEPSTDREGTVGGVGVGVNMVRYWSRGVCDWAGCGGRFIGAGDGVGMARPAGGGGGGGGG